MVKCEFCGTDNNVRYIQFGVSILGADVCPFCEKISRSEKFKIELATLLNGKNGDLDKFFSKKFEVKDPTCRKCGIWLDKDTWHESLRKQKRYMCKGCYTEQKIKRDAAV